MGRIANRYATRAARVTTEARRIRDGAGLALEQQYQKAADDTIYQRTPRPVTHKLHDSIARSVSGYRVRVGHRSAVADYVKFRRAMSGIGNYMGRTWNKFAPWNTIAVRRWLPTKRLLERRAMRRILKV